MNMEQDILALLDRQEIVSLAFLFGRATDSRTIEGYALFDECLMPDVEVIYTFGTWSGREMHKKITAENMLKVFTFTHHVIANPLVIITGETARASYRTFAAMGMKTAKGDQVIYGGATYHQHCVRTPDGWRVQKHVEENPWVDDDGSLLAMMTGQA